MSSRRRFGTWRHSPAAAGKLPEGAQKDIDKLIDALGEEIAGYQICANSFTYESIDTGIQKALSAPRASAAAQVRAVLGLSPSS
jgi:hypothetical protein